MIYQLITNLGNWLLDEGGRQEALQVEEGNFLIGSGTQNLAQLGIWQDDTLVGWVVQVVLLDVSIDAASYVSAGDFSTLGNTEEFVHFIGNLCWLGKAIGVGTSIRTLAFGLLDSLLHAVILLGQSLQENLSLFQQRCKGVNLGNQFIESGYNNWLICGRGSCCDWGSGLLLWDSLLFNSCGCLYGGGGSWGSGSSSLLYGSHRDLL